MKKSILITDMSCALPKENWSAADSDVHMPIGKRPTGGWRVIDYRATGYSGRYLHGDASSGELEIPLNLKGWHAVSIGLAERQWFMTAVEVKLTGDAHWQVLFTGAEPMHEEPWVFADLTGKSLHVRYPKEDWRVPKAHEGQEMHAQIYSVRATPMDAEDVAELKGAHKKPAIYFNDGFGIFYQQRLQGEDCLLDSLGQFDDSDFTQLAFCPGGADICNYPTKVGTVIHQDGWFYTRAGDKRVGENVKRMIDKGVDAMRLAVETAHKQKQSFLLYVRPQGWMGDPEFGHALASEFYRANPQWRCVEADGKPISKLSYAYPEVRKQLAGIIQEALDRGADGVALVLVRGFPVARYEEPVLEAFKARWGSDTRQLPETDPRLQGVWGDIATAWVKEVRALLDESGPGREGKRKELAVMPGPDLEWNQKFGFDIPRWAQEGLIDTVMPYPKGAETTTGLVNVAQYKKALGGTGVKLLPSLGSWGDLRKSLAFVRGKAHRFYSEGADGVSRWDTPAYQARLGLNCPVTNRLWVEKYLGEQEMSLLEVQGLSMEAYGPLLGF
jgi:hypothetical protein